MRPCTNRLCLPLWFHHTAFVPWACRSSHSIMFVSRPGENPPRTPAALLENCFPGLVFAQMTPHPEVSHTLTPRLPPFPYSGLWIYLLHIQWLDPCPHYLAHGVGGTTDIFNFVVIFGLGGIFSSGGLKFYSVLIQLKFFFVLVSLAFYFITLSLTNRILPG